MSKRQSRAEMMSDNAVVSNGEGENSYMQPKGPARRFMGKLALGAIITAPAFIVGGVYGVQRGLEHLDPVETVVTSGGGEQEIIKLPDLEFAETCWTATTIQVENAFAKIETKVPVLGSVGWKKTEVDMELENSLCVGNNTIKVEKDPTTGHVTMKIADTDLIKTRTQIIPGTHKSSTDNSPSYAIVENVVNTFEATPWVEGFEFSKNMARHADAEANYLSNSATIEGMHAAVENCGPDIWAYTDDTVENGIKDTILKGMQVEDESRTYDDISVKVEGKDFSEIAVGGKQSNVSEEYATLQQVKKSLGDLESNPGNAANPGQCKVPDEMKPKSPLDNVAAQGMQEYDYAL